MPPKPKRTLSRVFCSYYEHYESIPREDALFDRLGQVWCQGCLPRRDYINWGLAHQYPALSSPPYAEGAGLAHYATTAMLGDIERVITLFGAALGVTQEVA